METINFIIVSLFIALALALDAFSVAVGIGTFNKRSNRRQIFRLSFHFGLFQFIMPIIGWAVGRQVVHIIKDYDHWVAFLVLLILGVKMIIESRKPNEIKPNFDYTRSWKLISLSVVTSIDAITVGFGISLLQYQVLYMAIIIGVTASTMTIIGIWLGERLSDRFERYAEIVAAIVLIGIGFQILFSHLGII